MGVSLSRLGGWAALVGSAILSCSQSASGAVPRADTDLDAPVAPPPRLGVRFDFVPSHDGIRTVVLDEDSGRRTPLGDVPAGATCEARAGHGDGDMNRTLKLRCGSGLDVLIVGDRTTHTLDIRVQYDFLSDAPMAWDDLPVAPETILDPDDTLNDPAPARDCAGSREQTVELTLEHHAQPDESGFEGAPPFHMEDVRLHSDFGPIDAHVETPGCKRTCVGKGDATGHHYEYICGCTREPFEWSMQVHVRTGTVYAFEEQRMPEHGFQTFRGRWSVPCGARLRYPAGTDIVGMEDGTDYFLLSNEEQRAGDEEWEAMKREWGWTEPDDE